MKNKDRNIVLNEIKRIHRKISYKYWVKKMCWVHLCQFGQVCPYNKDDEVLVHMFVKTGMPT